MPNTKKCPECAEEILAEATKCKHCGSDISTAGALAKAGIGIIQIGFALMMFALLIWYLSNN